jgi:putative tryptophan/tyrosine transport system substrate-binding protein
MLSAALVLAFSCLSSVQAEPLRVTVVLSEERGVYQEFSELLRFKMPVARFALNTVNVDQPLVPADLYIAVGMKAAAELASRDIPVLNVLVPKAGYDKLPRVPSQRPNLYSAVFLDQPMERQVALLLAALPSTRNVGVLYAARPPELQNLRRLLADKNMHLHDRLVDEKQSLNVALEGILNESEVLFVLADAEIYNAVTIRNILLTAYRKQVPLLGISHAYVKAGALCAVFSTPEQVAVQTAAILQRYAESGRLPAVQYPSEFEVSVNMQVARSLNLHIKDAIQLRDEIRRAP